MLQVLLLWLWYFFLLSSVPVFAVCIVLCPCAWLPLLLISDVISCGGDLMLPFVVHTKSACFCVVGLSHLAVPLPMSVVVMRSSMLCLNAVLTNQSTVYTGGFDENVSPDILQGAFIPFGDIAHVELPMSDASECSSLPRYPPLPTWCMHASLLCPPLLFCFHKHTLSFSATVCACSREHMCVQVLMDKALQFLLFCLCMRCLFCFLFDLWL